MWDAVKDRRIEVALEHSERTVELRRRCLEQAQSQGLDPHEVTRCAVELDDAIILRAEILAEAGRIDEAWPLMEESLAHKRASSDDASLTWGLFKRAQLLVHSGRVDEARPAFEEVVRRAEESGERSALLGWYCHGAAMMALHERDLARAREMMRASHAAFQENAATGGFLLTLHGLAFLHGVEENWPLVARTLGAGDRARGTPYPIDWRDILQPQEDAARAALGDEEFEVQYASWAHLTPQQAAEAALPR
jgi:tetratricopeptide (TPR) repeat protein